MLRLLETRKCDVVNLAGAEAVSVRRLANVLGASLGVKPRIAVSNKYRDADFIADVGVYKRLFGPPRTCLEEGIARVLKSGKPKQRIGSE
jgi:hypothetical protein